MQSRSQIDSKLSKVSWCLWLKTLASDQMTSKNSSIAASITQSHSRWLQQRSSEKYKSARIRRTFVTKSKRRWRFTENMWRPMVPTDQMFLRIMETTTNKKLGDIVVQNRLSKFSTFKKKSHRQLMLIYLVMLNHLLGCFSWAPLVRSQPFTMPRIS